MRSFLSSAPVLAAVAILVWTTPDAVSGVLTGSRGAPAGEPRTSVKPPPVYEADCRTEIEGSRAVAYCHNPYPATDRVQLHVECERWWDVDVDAEPAEVGPAQYQQLTDRCWKEIRAAWVSHQPVADLAGR
ncbi:hypothetical protein ACFYT4_32435 [Streptomyces sp. NPDC004609]|uniref:hypothetical protein n=1 Tax=Streptomyces sp. NPDC004609 TaxID=3364704 RepID=UPI0036C17ED9